MIASVEKLDRRHVVVEELRDRAALENVRTAWDELYRRDLNATVFLSWAWMSALLSFEQEPWVVLALRVGSEYRAFLPVVAHEARRTSLVELRLAGTPLADYTGMLADPNFEPEAIASFADRISALPWDVFYLRNVLDDRILSLAQRVARSTATLQSLGPPAFCAYLELSNDFERVLQTFGPRTRRHLRLAMRQLEALPGARVGPVTESTLEDSIDVLLRLRTRRWGRDLAEAQRTFRPLFLNCFRTGCLRMYAAWSHATPVALNAGFVDPEKRAFSGYMVSHNDDFNKISPGKAILGYTIREAVAEGCRTFDFLRGDESYKNAFATSRRATSHHLLLRNTLRAQALFRGRAMYHRAASVARKLIDANLMSKASQSQRGEETAEE